MTCFILENTCHTLVLIATSTRTCTPGRFLANEFLLSVDFLSSAFCFPTSVKVSETALKSDCFTYKLLSLLVSSRFIQRATTFLTIVMVLLAHRMILTGQL